MIDLMHGDMLAILPTLDENSIDAVVTDPPYDLTSQKQTSYRNTTQMDTPHRRTQTGFMGSEWDGTGIAFKPETWQEVLRVMKPGAHLAAFGGSRTHHRMMVAIEDAGFEIRECCMWIYKSGMPKSHSVSLNIDKMLGHPNRGRIIGMASSNQPNGKPLTSNPVLPYEPQSELAKQWDGFGSALKPAFEPIVIARKPLIGSIASNVLAHGTGAINIDAARVPGIDPANERRLGKSYGNAHSNTFGQVKHAVVGGSALGRWPANIISDGSQPELETYFNELGYNEEEMKAFYYCSKANKQERADSKHPTIKPLKLMQWLCRLLCPPGGTILDPFAGSGTTGEAAHREGFNAILIEREDAYATDIRRRIARVEKERIVI